MQLRLGGLTFGGLSLLGSMIGLYGSLTITPTWSSVIESEVVRVRQRPFAGAKQLLRGGIAKEQDGEEFLLASETARAIGAFNDALSRIKNARLLARRENAGSYPGKQFVQRTVDPYLEYAYVERGLAYHQARNDVCARRSWQNAVDVAAESTPAQSAFATADHLFIKKQWIAAFAEYERAFMPGSIPSIGGQPLPKTDPRVQAAHFRARGFVFVKRGQFRAALGAWQSATMARPSETPSQFLSSDVLYILGQRRAATLGWIRVLELREPSTMSPPLTSTMLASARFLALLWAPHAIAQEQSPRVDCIAQRRLTPLSDDRVA